MRFALLTAGKSCVQQLSELCDKGWRSTHSTIFPSFLPVPFQAVNGPGLIVWTGVNVCLSIILLIIIPLLNSLCLSLIDMLECDVIHVTQ